MAYYETRSMTNGEPFDVNDEAHQAWRAHLEQLVGLELDPAIDLTETVDVREEKRPA